MASQQVKVVPLCIPDNFKFDGRTLSPDGLNSRKDLNICQQGLELLQNIHDPVIVICITGPARSGKSFFLSHLLPGVEFSLGHTTKSHTTGIWIAASPVPVKRDGQSARIILLDAEGTGALKSVDNGASPQWDTKIFSLCTLVSSVLIYNTNQPTREDLQKLGFVANFSDSICRNAQGEKDKKAGKKFKSCAPSFIWLIRNALLETSDDDSSDEEDETDEQDSHQDWNRFLTEEVLCQKKGSSDEEKNINAITKAIKRTFPSIRAVGLPPPSSDGKVCRNLHDPKVQNNVDVKIFLQKVKREAKEIITKANVKKLNGKIMTGSELAVFIELLVQAVNAEANMLPWENIYDTAVKSSLQNFLQKSLTCYDTFTKGIVLPCKTEELDHVLKKAFDEAIEQFTTQTKFTDETFKERFEYQLRQQLTSNGSKTFEDNALKSKDFCRTLIENLKRDSLNKLRQRENNLNFSEVDKELNYIYEEYRKKTGGYPNSVEVKKESEGALVDDFKIFGHNIVKRRQQNIIEQYSKDAKEFKKCFPCSENSLDAFQEKTKMRLIGQLKEEIHGCSKEENEKCMEEVRERFDETFQAMKVENIKLSSEKFDTIIERLKSLHLTPVVSDLSDVSYNRLLEAKRKIFEGIEASGELGPSVIKKKEIFENDINLQFQHYSTQIVKNAYNKARDLYRSQMEMRNKFEPCAEEKDLTESHQNAYKVSREKFADLTGGCDSTFVEKFQKDLDENVFELFAKLKVENDKSSFVFCEKLMKSLIAEHIKSMENDGSLVDKTSECKNLVLAQYDKRSKGPKAQSVRETYEHSIDTQIERVRSNILSNRATAALHGIGAAAGVAAGGMTAIGSKVASNTFHFVKGATSALGAVAPALANSLGSLGKRSKDPQLAGAFRDETLNQLKDPKTDSNDKDTSDGSIKKNDTKEENLAIESNPLSTSDDETKNKKDP